MIAETCLLYGWSREYVIGLTFDDIEKFYTLGKKSDLRRRGFDIKDKPTQEEIEADKELLFTQEERETIERFKNKNKKK